MFKNFLIENDLKMVDGIIREYYELADTKPEEKGVSAEKPTRGSRRERKVEEVVETAVETTETTQEVAETPVKVEQDTVETPVERPRRTRERKVETTEAAPVVERKTMAEKLAEGGYEVPERKPRTRVRGQ